MIYIAIGAAKMRHWWDYPAFFRRSKRALDQARRAEGCLHAEVFPADGHFISLTAWESPVHMKRYVTTGAHKEALKMRGKMTESSGFHGFWGEAVPSQAEAMAQWRAAAGKRAGDVAQNPVVKRVKPT